MSRARLRDLGIHIGRMPAGEHNAISDVPGVWVGHVTLNYDEPHVARTGATVIVPRGGDIWGDHTFAGFHSFNGCGEMTGMHWLAESGLLSYPIVLTATHQVGVAHEAIAAYGLEKGLVDLFALSVVGETWDGWLNDTSAFALRREHIYAAMEAAGGGPVAEGNVGGGTGMICHGFKGGIGTASRLAETAGGRYTLGALVQANHGARVDLRVDGVPVGRLIGPGVVPLPRPVAPAGGSVLVVIATDAPLLPGQCERLARRAAVGFARVGGIGHNGSGDLFLAFATGNHIPAAAGAPVEVTMLPNQQMNPLFEALAEAVEEAILNALTAAETMTGFRGRTAHALPLAELQAALAGRDSGEVAG
ncbi:MAG: P1 family peptidase [Candidatus Promineifilaceae bacterium]